jgi:uncharacterized sulfatase
MPKKYFMHLSCLLLAVAGAVLFGSYAARKAVDPALVGKPNFLLIVSDDQSWLHNSFAGDPAIRTPNFDRLAREGVYFENAYASAPSCTASRSAILSGQHFWRTGSGAQLWGSYPATLANYQQLLKERGYLTGYTGKGWGPGAGADGNPAGPAYNRAKRDADAALSNIDHVENFRRFLDKRGRGQPFSFWIAPTEPHRPYQPGSGVAHGIDLAAVRVPSFLPDTPEVRSDIADYLYEIEYFDEELGRILDVLKQSGELDNTVIVYVSDNGMPFPRAKSTNYEYGTHIPLVVRWGAAGHGGRRVADFVGLADLAPTFMALAGLPVPSAMTGSSFAAQLESDRSGRIDERRDAAFSGTERHIRDARPGHAGYPARAIHTANAIYIRNFQPDLWPAGDPPAYADIDDQSPSKLQVIGTENRFRDLATAKRPAEELYLLPDDPEQLHNVADDPQQAALKSALAQRLLDELRRSGDPALEGSRDVFDRYPYYAPK